MFPVQPKNLPNLNGQPFYSLNASPSSEVIFTQQFELIVLPTTLPGSVGGGGGATERVRWNGEVVSESWRRYVHTL